MRAVQLSLVILLVGCASRPAVSPPTEVPMTNEEDAIRAEISAFSAAWSRGDAQACAAFYTEDGVRVGAMGDEQRGRPELAMAYDQLLHGPLEGATVVQEPGTVRMLAPDLAVWRGGMEVRPQTGPPLHGHVVQVMKKIGDRWLILEGHPKLFPVQPQ